MSKTTRKFVESSLPKGYYMEHHYFPEQGVSFGIVRKIGNIGCFGKGFSKVNPTYNVFNRKVARAIHTGRAVKDHFHGAR